MLKVCFIDVTHWHAPSYYKTLHQLVDLAAVSDRNPQTGQQVAKDLGSRFYGDWREMLLKERPDFVFALGKHCDMAGTAQFLAGRRDSLRDGKAHGPECRRSRRSGSPGES